MKNKTTPYLLLLLLCMFLSFTSITANAATDEFDKNGLVRPTLTLVDDEASVTEFNVKQASYYSSEWEKYSNYYYYNQMSSAEKTFYNKLNTMCLYYLENNTTLSSGLTEYVSYTNLNYEDAYDVARVFYYSNPQYYYLFPYFNISYDKKTPTKGKLAIYVYTDFKKGSTRKAATAELKSKLDSYVTKINAESTLLEKEKLAHDLVVLNTTYKSGASYNQSAYSALCKGQTVCAGYAAAFSMLCNAVGIDTIMVTSDVHQWNYIRLNDSWYNIDCTWDDYDGTYGVDNIYIYFNRSKSMTLKYDEEDAHVTEALWYGYLPLSTLDSGATMYGIGSIATPTKTVSTPVIRSTANDGYHKITLSCATEDATIYYTLDGSTPSASSSKSYLYTGSFTINTSRTVKAIAVNNAYYDSAEASSKETVISKNAQVPTISSQPVSKTYTYGDTASSLKVTAKILDAGTLTYQWYKNSTNSTTGATKIANATSSSYTPSVSSVGTTYYYCIVTNTNANSTATKTASKRSSIVKVKVAAKNIKNCTISSMKTKTYTGSAIKQSITITNKSTKLKSGTDFTVSYSNNKAIGTAKVTLKGKGHYTGSVSYSFKILPKKATLKSLTAQTKKIKISWKKDSSITGYQIQYSTSKSFSSAKTVTVKKSGTTSYTVSNLKSKKTYYVRIRSYKTVGGKTYYGSWSAAKSAKTK